MPRPLEKPASQMTITLVIRPKGGLTDTAHAARDLTVEQSEALVEVLHLAPLKRRRRLKDSRGGSHRRIGLPG
jgi:hypothetical protein